MAEYSYSSPVVLAGEVDTTAPFESVKAAVNMFGEIADPRALKFPSAEKRASLELQQLRENLAATKMQLSQAQTAKSNLFEELLETKRLVEHKTSELAKVLSLQPSASDVAREADITYSKIEAVSNVVQEKYEAAVANLASTEQEVERLNAELENSVAAIEQQTNRSFEDGEAGNAGLYQENEPHHQPKQADLPSEMEDLQKEVVVAKVWREKLVDEITSVKDNLDRVKLEVEEARISEAKARKAVETAVQELTALRTRLDSLIEERATLSAVSESLRDELAKAKMELAAAKETESEIYALSPKSAAELRDTKAELAAAIAAEAKAKETIAGVTHALQKVTFEADEARSAAEVALEEAHKAKQELEEAKAAAFTAESKLEAASREVQAAKAAESMARAELKMLTEKAEVSVGENATVTQECESLRKRLQEAEELAEMKIAAANAKVDAAKASEREIQKKLEAAEAEVESNRTLAKQALHRAETAEAAKSAIENELRRRRKGADTSGTMGARGSPFHGSVQTPDRRLEPMPHTMMHRRSLDYATDHSFVSADVSAESIAQLMQLKVSPLRSSLQPVENEKEKSNKESKIKKTKSILKLGSYLSRRKSSVGST